MKRQCHDDANNKSTDDETYDYSTTNGEEYECHGSQAHKDDFLNSVGNLIDKLKGVKEIESIDHSIDPNEKTTSKCESTSKRAQGTVREHKG